MLLCMLYTMYIHNNNEKSQSTFVCVQVKYISTLLHVLYLWETAAVDDPMICDNSHHSAPPSHTVHVPLVSRMVLNDWR